MPATSKAEHVVRSIVSRLGDVQIGVACKGTVVESTTFGSGGKVFLFMQLKDGSMSLRLKLGPSAPEAGRLASREPERFSIGSQKWAKLTLGASEELPADLLRKWIEESRDVVVRPIDPKSTGRTKVRLRGKRKTGSRLSRRV
jgi:hypothetical protein